jgi:hypothetical protein
MAGSATFAMGSNAVSNQNPSPPAWSTGSAIIEWTLLGGWIGGIWFINVTALHQGPGQTFNGVYVGLCPVDPVTGNWVDVFSPSSSPVVINDGGVIEISAVTPPNEYAMIVPLIGNAYQVVLYGNAGTTATLSTSLIVHD